MVKLLVFFTFVAGYSQGFVEIAPVLQMLNLPWEGKCPATPPLHLLPELNGWVGRCPTVYRVLELPPSSEPRAVLAGYCDPSCHNTPCSPLGNYRCRNHTVAVQVAAPQLTDLGEVLRVVRTLDVPVGCVCRSKKYNRLESFTPLTAD